jgi:hypothetical protein
MMPEQPDGKITSESFSRYLDESKNEECVVEAKQVAGAVTDMALLQLVVHPNPEIVLWSATYEAFMVGYKYAKEEGELTVDTACQCGKRGKASQN